MDLSSTSSTENSSLTKLSWHKTSADRRALPCLGMYFNPRHSLLWAMTLVQIFLFFLASLGTQSAYDNHRHATSNLKHRNRREFQPKALERKRLLKMSNALKKQIFSCRSEETGSHSVKDRVIRTCRKSKWFACFTTT